MDFYSIINTGFDNVDNRKDLKSYFIREFKKAERDSFYSLSGFFTPLFRLLEGFRKQISNHFDKSKKWYEDIIQKAKENKLEYYDYYYSKCLDKEGISYVDFKREQNLREYDERRKELQDFTIEKAFTRDKKYRLSDIQQIEQALKQAENDLQYQLQAKEESISLPKESGLLTITDRILREIETIELILTSQCSKYDEKEVFPFIVGPNGKSGIDGRYISALDILSDVELLNLQLYKQHFTERFESAANNKLLLWQLSKIRQKASQIIEYYKANLTGETDTVKEYVDRKKEFESNKQFDESEKLFNEHCATVAISQYRIITLYLGVTKSKIANEIKKYPFFYISDNRTLVSFCQDLINFINVLLENKQDSGVEGLSAHQQKTANFLQFEREIEKAKIPFADVVLAVPLFKNELFSQFCNADKKPCFDLYLADFYTVEELKKGFEEAHARIPVSNSKEVVAASHVADTPFETHILGLIRQFDEMNVQKVLPSKYYCPDIEKTVIVQTLRAIYGECELLRKAVFDDRTDKYKEAEIRSKNVVELSERLEGLASLIIEHLKRDNENLYLLYKEADQTKVEFWQALKSNFNNSMIVQEQATRLGINKAETKSEPSYIEKRIMDFTKVFQQYGFFTLPKVKALSRDGQQQIIEMIAKSELPYCIAMFDFLGFLEYLKAHFRTKTDLYIQVSKWFDADKQGRTVAGNIRVLSANTEESTSRYTADRHKETVKNDYERIK